jgi:FMNH2-dependent dimethyl sulfone monooxygenase
MITSWRDDPRRATHPLFNDNRLKLGLFGLNAGTQAMTLAPGQYVADWDRCSAIVGIADRLGLEAMVSLVSWGAKPELEPFSWATGLGALHRNPAFVSTMHVQLNHPTFVAKASATVHAVTHGRFALNIVAGTNPDTFRAFGAPMEDHETRYAHAAEFMDLLKRLWTEDAPFDFSGRFYQIPKAVSLPKPSLGLPPIMNAGTSDRGQHFAAKYADLVFTHVESEMDDARVQLAAIKELARREYGRDVQVWTHGYAVVRDTQADADAFLQYYAVDHADTERVARWVKTLGENAQSQLAADKWKVARNWAAGGGVDLVGTPESITEKLRALSRAGLDGILLKSIEPEHMLERFGRDILPRLEQAGLRKPTKAHGITEP